MTDTATLAVYVYTAVEALKAWLPRRARLDDGRTVAVALALGAVIGVGGWGLGAFPGETWQAAIRHGLYAAVGAGGISGVRSVAARKRGRP